MKRHRLYRVRVDFIVEIDPESQDARDATDAVLRMLPVVPARFRTNPARTMTPGMTGPNVFASPIRNRAARASEEPKA